MPTPASHPDMNKAGPFPQAPIKDPFAKPGTKPAAKPAAKVPIRNLPKAPGKK